MKINNIMMKEQLYQTKNRMKSDAQAAMKGQVKNGRVFAGNLNLDPIAQKRRLARKEAMRLIGGQFQIDSDIDADLAERDSHIDKVREENKYAGQEIVRLEEDRRRMIEEYGVEPGSPELIGIQKEISYWKTEIYNGQKEIREDIAAIDATHEALLKRTHDMTDAAGAAEDVMDAASDEIIGMLKQEAMDKMAEDRKEEQEKIERAEEKKEEKEELLEKKQEQEKLEELSKEIASTDSVVDKKKLQQEIAEILASQKLLEEDMKGIGVDMSI